MTKTFYLNPMILTLKESIEPDSTSDLSVVSTTPNANLTPFFAALLAESGLDTDV